MFIGSSNRRITGYLDENDLNGTLGAEAIWNVLRECVKLETNLRKSPGRADVLKYKSQTIYIQKLLWEGLIAPIISLQTA